MSTLLSTVSILPYSVTEYLLRAAQTCGIIHDVNKNNNQPRRSRFRSAPSFTLKKGESEGVSKAYDEERIARQIK